MAYRIERSLSQAQVRVFDASHPSHELPAEISLLQIGRF